jgi:hypothetical protein
LEIALCNNDSITSLDFSKSNYFGEFLFLGNKNLKSFKYLFMDDKVSPNFIKSFMLNQSITDLWVSFDGDSTSLIETLSQHQSIENICLRNCKPIDLKVLLKNSKLKSLELNSINLENLNEIDFKICSIEYLNLENCRIDFTKNFKFLENIFDISSLKSLNLSVNELGMNGVEFIISMLGNNHQLESLTLSGIFIYQ